jgi:hypothetical protein
LHLVARGSGDNASTTAVLYNNRSACLHHLGLFAVSTLAPRVVHNTSTLLLCCAYHLIIRSEHSRTQIKRCYCCHSTGKRSKGTLLSHIAYAPSLTRLLYSISCRRGEALFSLKDVSLYFVYTHLLSVIPMKPPHTAAWRPSSIRRSRHIDTWRPALFEHHGCIFVGHVARVAQ